MKLFFTKLLLYCTVLFFALNAKAQEQAKDQQKPDQYPDYVITIKGDTLHCNIGKNFLSGTFKYTLSGSGSLPVKIKPDEIKEYYIARTNTIFGSVITEDRSSTRFLQILEKGKLNLYVYSNTTSGFVPTAGGGMAMTGPMDHSQWYISKNGGIAKILKGNGLMISGGSRKQRKADFGEMLKDNNLVYQKYIKDDKFDIDQIQNLVHWYNTGEKLPEPPPDNHLDY